MKKLALLILGVFICSGSIYALSDQNVEEISKTSEILADAFVKKINEGSLGFSQGKAIIEGGIDYYLAKVKGMSEKDVPNLYTFEQINGRLIDNQLNNSNKRLEHNGRNYMFASYAIRDSLLFVDEKTPAKDIVGDKFSEELLIPGKEKDIYIIRAKVDGEKSLGSLLLTYGEGKDETTVDKNKNRITIKKYGNVIRAYGAFVNKNGKSVFYKNVNFDNYVYSSMGIESEQGVVYYVYLVPKQVKDIKLTFNNDMAKPSIALSELTNFKYSSDAVDMELEKMKGGIPFCIRALGGLTNFRTEKMRNCEWAFNGTFHDGMSEWLFKQWNDENGRPYSIGIMSSSVGTQYCKETKWGKDCLWIDDGKVTSTTSYDYK
ncbi:MAG: hypothetical protein HG439_004605 [candidate division SR1 bacterium]|nr:hypothetical protein [candidate division SR1 bacterium]